MQKNRYLSLFAIAILISMQCLYAVPIAREPTNQIAALDNQSKSFQQMLEKTGSEKRSEAKITLVTGETVVLTRPDEDGKGITVIPDSDNLHSSYQMLRTERGTYLIPDGTNLNKLDMELFNIEYLLKEEYDLMPALPLIVKMKDASAMADGFLKGIENTIDVRMTGVFPAASAFAVQLPTDKIANRVEALLQRPEVEKIWLDRKVQVRLSDSVPLIGAPELWGMGYDGTGIEIAILDTGIDKTHPSLDDFDDNPATTDPKVIQEIDFTDDYSTTDLYGHGTHVAGTAAGTGAESFPVCKGVAPGASLWNVKVLNRYGSGYYSWVISGIQYAAYGPDAIPGTGDEADIISMSLGASEWTDGTDPLSMEVDAAVDAGVVVVVAAGNSGSYSTIGIPATARKAITVGASTKYDTIAGFSSRGPTVDSRLKPDVLAPGESIVSSVPYNLYGMYYLSASGTSMATPHVSGAAALLMQKGVPAGWSAPQYVKNALISTGVDLGYDVYTQGGGRISVPSAATTSILVDPATISFGRYVQSAIDSATLRFYNLNATASATLQFNVTLRDALTGEYFNKAALNTSTITIGASSSRAVSLTIDSNVPISLYEGDVTAFNAATGETIHAIFGFSRFNRLTVNKIKMDGSPAEYEIVWIYKTNSTSSADQSMNSKFGTIINGTVEFLVGSGDFNIWSTSTWNASVVWAVKDEYPVLGDTVVTLDERDAVPITFNENKNDQVFSGLYNSINYEEQLSWAGTYYYSWLWTFSYPYSTTTYFTPTSLAIAHSYEYYPQESYNSDDPWRINTPVWHKLFYARQGVDAPVTYVADYNELAQRKSNYKTALTDATAYKPEWAESGPARIWGAFGWTMDIPQSRLEYISPNANYYGIVDCGTGAGSWTLYGLPRTYSAGEISQDDWNAHPLSPQFWIDRYGDQLNLNLYPIYCDAAGKQYYAYSYSGIVTNATVIRNSETIFVGGSTSSYLYVYLSPEPTPATYEVIVESRNVQALSAYTKTFLNFEYTGFGDYRPPDIQNIAVSGLDLRNIMWPGNAQVQFDIWDENALSEVTLEYSTDDGSSWSQTPLTPTGNTYEASIEQLSAVTVALRINATDSTANRISHTILRAFYVRTPITLADFPMPFVVDGVINSTMVIGEAGAHGAFGIGAHTVDVYSALYTMYALGTVSTGYPEAVIDTWIATYDAGSGEVTMLDNTSNLISIAGAPVNLVTYQYSTDFTGAFSVGGRSPPAPVYFYRPWQANPADVRTWIVFEGEEPVYSDWDITSGESDYSLIELVYDSANSRYVLIVNAFTGQGTEAGCKVLAAKLQGQPLSFEFSGKAMLLKWADANSDQRVQLEEVTLVTSYPSTPSMEVAIVGAAYSQYMTDVQAYLLPFSDLTAVDIIDVRSSTPSLSTLQNYDAVLVFSDYPFFDPVALGDVLADYVDLGGGVVLTTFAWFGPTYDLEGRIMTDYSPFEQLGGSLYTTANLGAYNATHPIMDGVSFVSEFYRDNVTLTTGAELVAVWDDGDPFVATKGQVVGITLYPPKLEWTGDVPTLIHNALLWSVLDREP